MGYLSKVEIWAQQNATALLENAWKKFENEHPDSVCRPDGTKKHRDGSTSFFWDWQKWYENYDSIKCTMDALERAKTAYDMQMSGFEYTFIRIGEQEEDIERTVCGNYSYPNAHILTDYEYDALAEEIKQLRSLLSTAKDTLELMTNANDDLSLEVNVPFIHSVVKVISKKGGI